MTLAKVVADLKREEGWRAEPYEDHLGFWTIGYGFLIDRRKPTRLPESVGELWLEELVQERQRALDDALPWLLAQPDEIRDALTNMAYQMGVSGVLKFKGMLEALKAGKRELAANEALDSLWARQTPERARRVAEQIRGA
jgi:lysozyme